jgi:hypothetical protein
MKLALRLVLVCGEREIGENIFFEREIGENMTICLVMDFGDLNDNRPK